jgi:hypothetical protein
MVLDELIEVDEMAPQVIPPVPKLKLLADNGPDNPNDVQLILPAVIPPVPKFKFEPDIAPNDEIVAEPDEIFKVEPDSDDPELIPLVVDILKQLVGPNVALPEGNDIPPVPDMDDVDIVVVLTLPELAEPPTDKDEPVIYPKAVIVPVL